MTQKRQPRHKAGADETLGRVTGTKQKAPAAIIAHLTRIRHAVCYRLGYDLTWNRDISLENDRLRVVNESLRDRVRELEDG